MGQKYINFAAIPVFFLFCALEYPYPQFRCFKGILDARKIMLEIVEHQGMLPVQFLKQLQERFQLTVMDFMDAMFIIVHRSVGQLLQLV